MNYGIAGLWIRKERPTDNMRARSCVLRPAYNWTASPTICGEGHA
jgi:hypothetical protein